MFADEISVIIIILSLHVHNAMSSVVTYISNVKVWMTENNLELNEEKT